MRGSTSGGPLKMTPSTAASNAPSGLMPTATKSKGGGAHVFHSRRMPYAVTMRDPASAPSRSLDARFSSEPYPKNHTFSSGSCLESTSFPAASPTASSADSARTA